MAKYIRLERIFKFSVDECLELIGQLLGVRCHSFDQLSEYSIEASALKLNEGDLLTYDLDQSLRHIPVTFEPDASDVNWNLVKVMSAVGCSFVDRAFTYEKMAKRNEAVAFYIEELRLVEIRTNIDDMSGEVFTHLYPMLLSKGARDVYTLPIMMKKNRPAHLLCVLCEESKVEFFSELLFRETTTFGVRYYPVERVVLDRRFMEVVTPYGNVTVKYGYYCDALVKCIPEYETCMTLSQKKGVSFLEVYYEAIMAGKKKIGENSL